MHRADDAVKKRLDCCCDICRWTGGNYFDVQIERAAQGHKRCAGCRRSSHCDEHARSQWAAWLEASQQAVGEELVAVVACGP
jgi:hypothetical protein